MDKLSLKQQKSVVGGTSKPQIHLRPSIQSLVNAIEGFTSLPAGFSLQIAQRARASREFR